MQSVEKVWGSELDDQLLYCPGSSNQGTPVSQSEIFIGSAGSASIAPRFTFNSTGSAACMWSSHRLRCYLGGFTVDFSTFFDWSPASDLPSAAFPLDDCKPTNWRIVDTLLLSFPYIASGGRAAGKGKTQGLAILLTSKTVSRSLLCFLPDLRKPSCGRTISLHGKAVMLGLVWPDENQSSVPLSGSSLEAFSETVFAGVLSIAFEHGLVAVIDLCLDWPVSKVGLNFRAEPAVASALAQSRKLLADGERVSPFSPTLEHTLMHLNDAAVSWDRFYYQLPNEKVAIKIPSHSVTVTLLQSIRPIKSLVVGFSFGGWQIWRLTDLKLIYTFQNPSLHCAVVSCAFVEPSDDPRFCCYLWVGWQAPKKSSRRRRESKEETPSTGPTVPTCTLFQLGFRNRIENTNPVTQDIAYEYEHFFGASPRLSTKLTALCTSETPFVSQLKAIQPLSSSYTANRGLHSSRLTAITWRVTAHIVRIGLFDIDRWYHAQMPSSIWPDNSFFAVYDAALDSSKSYPLTAQILPQSLLAFWVRTLRLERASAGLCGTTRTKSQPNVTNGVPLLRKPLPEVQLRPSVHAFEAIVPFVFVGSSHQWPDDCSPHLTGNFVSLKFVSRQEKCLQDLTRACLSEKQASQPRHQPPSSSVFNVYLWITEAVACGLIRELEDVVDDVSHIFDDSDPLMGIRLSLGLDSVTPEMLEQLGVDPNECFSGEPALALSSPRQTGQKRRRLVSEHAQSEVTSGGGQTLGDILRPQWVVVANTLFEQKMLRELMALSKLKNSSRYGPATTTTSENTFLRAWIWLRWLGYKTTFDRLCEPIFLTAAADEEAAEMDSQKLSSSKLDEISSCVSQLRLLADVALTILAPSEKQENDELASDTDKVRSSDRLRIIRAYSDYTRAVGLLLRLGLLPQLFSEDAVKSPVFGKSGSVRQLTPYCSAPLARFIAAFEKRYAGLPDDTQDSSFSPPITLRLLKHLFGLTEEKEEEVDGTTNIAKNIWVDQEDLVDTSGSSQLLVYPPRRLQSVCALWQAWEAPARARTALLIFLLFDWVAVLALLPTASEKSADSKEVPDSRTQRRRVRYRGQSPEKEISPTVRAIKMHKYVVTEFLKEFPFEKPLLTTIQTLWLFDRCRFKEILTSDLSPIVTGQVTSLSQLPEIFPDQAAVLVRLSLFFGQTRLALLFDPAHTTEDPALYANFLPANPLAAAAPLAELTRLRRMYGSVAEDEAAALFLQCVQFFLKYGRLLDLLNSSLSSWETSILTDYLKSSGHRDLLFCCLLARSQYKAAANLVNELDPNQPAACCWGESKATPAGRCPGDQACVELQKIVDSCLPLSSRLRRELMVDIEVPTDVALRPFSTHDTQPGADAESEQDGGRLEAVSLVSGPAFLRTPKTPGLPVQMNTVDRNQRSEFWRIYNKMRAMDTRPSDFKSPSPMGPLVTASVRRRHEKMLGYVYSEPVDSARKSTRRRSGSQLLYVSTDSRPFHSSSKEEVRKKLDFWSELRKWHKPGAAEETVCETTVLPDVSFLKPDLSKTTDGMPDDENDEASAEQSYADGEVTINPRTLTLHEDGAPVVTTGRPQSPETSQLDCAPVLSSTSRLLKHLEAVSSEGLSTSFTFSPPINLLRAHRTAQDPLQSIFSSHFAFSSPTSLRRPMSEVIASPQLDPDETDLVEDVSGGMESTPNAHGESGISNESSCSASGDGIQNVLSFSPDGLGADHSVGEDASQKAHVTEQSDDFASVVSGDETELFTPRRSRRQAKRPERYQAA